MHPKVWDEVHKHKLCVTERLQGRFQLPSLAARSITARGVQALGVARQHMEAVRDDVDAPPALELIAVNVIKSIDTASALSTLRFADNGRVARDGGDPNAVRDSTNLLIAELVDPACEREVLSFSGLGLHTHETTAVLYSLQVRFCSSIHNAW